MPKFNISILLHLAATLIAFLWVLYEGGFAPWATLISSLIINSSSSDVRNALLWPKRTITPEQKAQKREKWREVFEEYFNQNAVINNGTDAIIHDIDRADEYPVLKPVKSISAWFRVGLAGTYHKGILVGLTWTYLEKVDGYWERNDSHSNGTKVLLIGKIPYEYIETVNFDGDQYYNKPHIVCSFWNKGEPYEELFYGEEFKLHANSRTYYTEICKYSPPLSKWRLF